LRIYYNILVLVIFFLGCSSKSEIEYNKPAIYWYQKMINNIANDDLDRADEYFTSLFSEHPNSIFLKESMIVLALAHVNNEEYLLANFYLDEFIKKYGNSKSIEFARYLKVKASFLSFKYPFRNQELLYDTLKDAQAFKKTYPDSKYTPFVDTMIAKVDLALKSFNKEIAKLYKKMDRDEAKDYYLEKIKESTFKDIKAENPSLPWYRQIFE